VQCAGRNICLADAGVRTGIDLAGFDNVLRFDNPFDLGKSNVRTDFIAINIQVNCNLIIGRYGNFFCDRSGW
jgi:hypothetical protein